MRINNRSLFKPSVHGSYKVENKADESTVYLYDEISWWGIDASQFVKDLNNISSGTIHLRVNSPGGSVFDGTAIYNALKQHKAKVIAHVDGLAASIASVIIMAADEIRMGDNAFLMIHEPWSMVAGNADMMRQEAELLDKVAGTIANTYVNKTGKDGQEIKDLMAAETWFTAEEALEAGFIDVIDKDKPEKAQAKATIFDLSAYANVPEALKESKPMPTEKEIEKALRDVGCSHKQAKAILAEGFKENLRDVDDPEPEPAPEQKPRDVVSAAPRDVVQPEQKKKDRTTDLLIRAEVLAPSRSMEATA